MPRIEDLHPGRHAPPRTARRIALATIAAGAGLLAGCSRSALLATLTPDGGADREASIAYGADPRQRLDIYRPADAPPVGGKEAARPVVVFFYGGSWNSGRREDYRFVGRALAASGIVTVIPDYRLYPQVRYPEFLRDAAMATAWTLRGIDGHGGDRTRVFVMGHSAGAYNAAMLALDRRWLAAEGLEPSALAGWIGLAGPYDFLPIRNPQVQPVFDHPDYPGGSQPIDHVSAASPRAFVGAAATDALVDPKRNSAQMASRLEAAGVPAVHREYAGVGHTTLLGAFAGPLRWFAPVLDDVSRFVGES